jgi:hypothetical protein
MRHVTAALVVLLVLLHVGTASASHSRWYVNKTNHDYECNHFADEDFAIGPFSSLAACQAFLGPSSGVVCQSGETLTVAWPNVYAYLHEGVTVGACSGGGGGGGGGPTHAATRPPDSSFLCYSAGGDLYVAASAAEAAVLEAAGYWLPTAVAGNVAGGTNIGAYHLVCMTSGALGVDGNAPPASQYVDDGGDLLDAATAAANGWIGVYPVQASG